jgi:hypothetical protein
MWRQRYDNEALYPYNGPAATRYRASRIRTKRNQPTKRKPVQLKMHLEWNNTEEHD